MKAWFMRRSADAREGLVIGAAVVALLLFVGVVDGVWSGTGDKGACGAGAPQWAQESAEACAAFEAQGHDEDVTEHDPNADANNCSRLPAIRADIALIGRQIVDLQGGSVQGIPTYSEATAFQNRSAINALRSKQTTLRQAESRLSFNC